MPARIRFFRLLSRWSRDGEIDLIEVPDYGAPAAGWPSLPVPVIVRLSGSSSFVAVENGRALKRTFYLELASLRRADFWCSESRYLADKTRQLFKLRSEPNAIIYNPVDLSNHSCDVPRSRNRIVFAGTLNENKGVERLLECWPQVHAARPEAELHIFGKDTRTATGGSMRESLESRLRGTAGAKVHFHGHVPLDEVLAEFQTARLAVLPSYAEGFALTPLHAMAAGCPTIYTRRASGPELIEDGKNGLLIDPAQPSEIAEAILRLLRDDELTDRLGRAGRRRIEENFSLETIIKQNESFYEDCLRRFDARSPSRFAAS